ncbi:MAG: hypothetical protein E7612_02690 [Ruminococcaceae bacterium]|nr:hypothetical protein [Oscillospiraceae bacterium]
MKNIISIVLVLACAFMLFSCDKEDATLSAFDEINGMYNAISPSMVYTKTTQEFGDYTLTGEATLKIGMVDGAEVAVYEYDYQQLRDLESGSSIDVLGVIENVSGIKEYHEELGVRVDGGKWDADGENFAPATGATALTLTKETVVDFKEDAENKAYTFTVLAANTKAVFGYEITSDVAVTIAHSGADIIGVKMEYNVANEDNEKYPTIKVTVEASYSYESQTITIK